ncbi:MAG TPA: presenilin family intramembrane aspartyl protease PSH [Candidatus Thalassarchaeaceae archaeon]|nr:presenilin family intramembrane aspartyl protease PSH [Candidatus Thalassarchaeaceae archaeon]
MADSEIVDLLSAIREQWTSMAGMAAMFTSSILIGIFIQPFYNFDAARAFGEEGTTEAGNIVLELGMIFLFTIAVIWLARKGLEVVIKAIIFLALGYSLLLAIGPFVAILLALIGEGGVNAWTIATFSLTVALMYTLHRFPEWYIVNSVGILVGAGVITMIGIAFVPVLIILFMVLAAIYDHWAVNKSKHMLELADTMIGMKLPVLLVAPRSLDYSFIEQDGDVMRKEEQDEFTRSGLASSAESEAVDNVLTEPNKTKGGDALFMGLGDVIFPGMLVISSITFLPEMGPVVFDFWGDPTKPVHLGPMIVGMGTLIGGLLGYFTLMTQVARGKPQAGLPLLNGGSILGYLVSGTIALGLGKLWQDITFL